MELLSLLKEILGHLEKSSLTPEQKSAVLSAAQAIISVQPEEIQK